MKNYQELKEQLVRLQILDNPEVVFDEETHTYIYNGFILKSVTQLLSEKGISPDYSNVDSELLKEKASKGSAIHKVIEEWIKYGKTPNEYQDYLDNFIQFLLDNELIVVGSEVKVANANLGGCVDLILYDTDIEEYYIVDIKTTSIIHTYSVSWQLTLYDRLLPFECDWAYVLHFDNNARITFKRVVWQNASAVESLLEFDMLPTLAIDKNELAVVENAVALIEDYKKKSEEYEKVVKSFQEKLINAMEQNGVKTFESDKLKITYVAPIKKETIDSKRLKSELPDIAKKYIKETTTKASVRITLKGE